MAISNDYMKYDETTGRYLPTELLLTEKCGIDVRGRLFGNGTANVDGVISFFLQSVSDIIYDYIHGFNVNNLRQDIILSTNAAAFVFLRKAFEYQSVHMWMVGDLTYSTDARERENAVNQKAKAVLGSVIPDFGRSILYSGRI